MIAIVCLEVQSMVVLTLIKPLLSQSRLGGWLRADVVKTNAS